MKEIRKYCDNCGSAFVPKIHNQKFCSSDCWSENDKKKREERKKVVPSRVKDIDEVLESATEHGISYGKEVMRTETLLRYGNIKDKKKGK